VGGRIVTRQVHLGPAGSLTKEKLWAKSLELERRLAGFLEEATGNLGRINESRQVMSWWVSGWWAVFIGCGSFARPYGISQTAVRPVTHYPKRFRV
jgi:hypothetical protein